MKLRDIPKLTERLKYIRMTRGMSQSEMARLAGTSQQSVQQAESGKARNPRYLPKLARELKVPIEWLTMNILPDEDEIGQARYLSDQEEQLLDIYGGLGKEGRNAALDFMKSRAAENKSKRRKSSKKK